MWVVFYTTPVFYTFVLQLIYSFSYILSLTFSSSIDNLVDEPATGKNHTQTALVHLK